MTTTQRLRELLEKATHGPWCMCDGHLECRGVCDVGPVEVHAPSAPFNRGDDAPLIVAMRNALPALLEVVEAANECERCRGSLARSIKAEQALFASLALLDAVTL
jgi:hypothetical protein